MSLVFQNIVGAFRRDRARICAKFERPRRFRGSNMNHKKRLVDAEASSSIHASIHRSLVSPTALGRTHSPGLEGGGGSIFWKMRDIGLPSYSNNLSTVYTEKLTAV
jgi:hypothetical protein